MRDLGFFSKIYIAVDPVDFRRQAHGLALLVELSLKQNPIADKSLFVFTNKRMNAVKILYWDATGFALWWKTLERDRFRWPRGDTIHMVQPKELRWLLEGIDLSAIKKHRRLEIDSL